MQTYHSNFRKCKMSHEHHFYGWVTDNVMMLFVTCKEFVPKIVIAFWQMRSFTLKRHLWVLGDHKTNEHPVMCLGNGADFIDVSSNPWYALTEQSFADRDIEKGSWFLWPFSHFLSHSKTNMRAAVMCHRQEQFHCIYYISIKIP